MSKSLKKLSRMELLQLLLEATESNESLLAENAKLKEVSSSRLPQAAKVGSIAEAALQANGFFEAAQRSADDYLREIKQLRDDMLQRSNAQAQAAGALPVQAPANAEQAQRALEQIQQQAKTYIQDVQTYANNVVGRANQQAEATVAQARVQHDQIIAQANAQAKSTIEGANAQAASLIQAARAQTAALADQNPAPVAQASATSGASATPDPSETGQLIRRGRHVRMPEGA